MAFKMKGSPILYGTGKHKSALKANRDSIDNNRHAPARTKDTVDPADVKIREKKNTSKRVPTDKEARAEAVKNLYKSKSPAKKKDNRSLYQKAKDEGKQLAAGAKAAGRVLADKDYFKPVKAVKEAAKAYTKEEKNQAAKRKGGKSSPAKKTTNKKAKIKKDLKGGREMLAAKKNPGKPKRVGTSIYEDTYQGTGDTRSTRKAERKFAKADKKLAKGKFKQAERKVKKGRKTVVSMPSGPTTRSIAKKKGCKKKY